jgi:hypothetical protein
MLERAMEAEKRRNEEMKHGRQARIFREITREVLIRKSTRFVDQNFAELHDPIVSGWEDFDTCTLSDRQHPKVPPGLRLLEGFQGASRRDEMLSMCWNRFNLVEVPYHRLRINPNLTV